MDVARRKLGVQQAPRASGVLLGLPVPPASRPPLLVKRGPLTSLCSRQDSIPPLPNIHGLITIVICLGPHQDLSPLQPRRPLPSQTQILMPAPPQSSLHLLQGPCPVMGKIPTHPQTPQCPLHLLAVISVLYIQITSGQRAARVAQRFSAALGPGGDPGDLGSSPMLRSLHGACFSLCLCLYLSLSYE